MAKRTRQKSSTKKQELTTETVTVNVTTEHHALINNAQGKYNLAVDYVVDSNETFESAATELKTVKARIKELDSTRKGITKPMDESKSRIMDLFRAPLNLLEQAEKALKLTMITYTQDQEKKRLAEEARLREIARKEEESLRKRAQKAADKGKEEKAENLEQQADSIPVPVVTYSRPRTTGISTRKTWFAEVTDPDELLKAVLDGDVPRAALTINMKFLNGQAKALKKELNYPGVVVKFSEDIAARST